MEIIDGNFGYKFILTVGFRLSIHTEVTKKFFKLGLFESSKKLFLKGTVQRKLTGGRTGGAGCSFSF